MKSNLEFIQWMILFFDVNYEPRGKLQLLFFTFSLFSKNTIRCEIGSDAKASAIFGARNQEPVEHRFDQKGAQISQNVIQRILSTKQLIVGSRAGSRSNLAVAKDINRSRLPSKNGSVFLSAYKSGAPKEDFALQRQLCKSFTRELNS